MSLRLSLAAPDAGPAPGLAGWGASGIVDGLARALRARGHEVTRDTQPGGVPAVVLQAETRRAAWILGEALPGPETLSGFDVVAAPTAELRSRLRRARAAASAALFTIPVGPLDAPDSTPADPYRVALVGHGERHVSALRALADALARKDPRLRVEVVASRPSAAGGSDADLPVVPVATMDDLLARLPRYGFVVAGPSAIGLADVGLLAARRAGSIVVAARAPGRHEMILHEYDGFVSDEPDATPAFAEECVRQIAALAGDPARARLFRERARRGTPGWDEIARLWERALDGQPRPARVTVVMSAYNVEPFVEDAVDSVLAQTYRDFDLVVVDDGSTDGTTAILRGIHDPRLLVLEQANGGVWAALNAGLVHAHRELVARMDADDLTHPRRLALQVDFLDHHPRVGLLGTGFYKIEADGRIQVLVHYPTEDGALKRQLTRENAFLHPTVVFRRRVLERTGPYRRCEAEDYDLWLRVSERVTVANLEAPLHRLRRTGQTRVARFEREIIASAADLRRQALDRCLGRPDAAGYPPWRRPRWLGLPALRRDEVRAYAGTLHAWAETVRATQPGVAARLYAKAILVRPLDTRAWLALARLVLGRPQLLYRPLAWLRRRLVAPR